ncbi:MAG: FMN-binding glutamate synthase family protein [Gammaproteobacteria bacterium]|jgi:glutamate synthase domain-containing protein 2|nr:FMN-binding glutamate synthase family protein [Gammaproteobacteria bacterium]
MHRQLYVGFGIVLIGIALLLILLHVSLEAVLALLIILIGVGLYDYYQTEHTILRNFPLLGHIRFILEFFRPEIRQYLVASDQEERPFNRRIRSVIYQRAKKERDTVPFGTQYDVLAQGYECVQHSLVPKKVDEVESRLVVGGKNCAKPYSASYLNISAMSFGSLSPNAIIALNEGAKMGNFAHNTGEGGISPYHLQGGDITFQIGTGYFGCRNQDGHFDPAQFKDKAHRNEVKMIEIKLSQGAKPAHGGILPGAKVDKFIAEIRGIEIGKDCISPPAHSAFTTPIGLLEFIAQLRELSGGKPVGFKLCIGKRHEFLAICKAMLKTGITPDFITIDGAEGGTGAAPMEFADHMGTPLHEALLFVHNALTGINLRSDIRIIAAGKVATGFDMVARLALGADMCNAGRAFMLALGCIQSLVCHNNACPTGVTTQNPRLARGLVVAEKKQRVANYHAETMRSFMEIIGAMGLSNPRLLSPAHIFRQTEKGILQPYNEIYTYYEPGVLLNGEVSPRYARDWAMADSDKF